MTTYPARTRRWTRAEYGRLIEVGVFRPGEPVELLGGELIVSEPQGSAHYTAIGLIEGNPIYSAIMERKPEALSDIKAAVARNVAAELGDRPLRAPLLAFVFTARKL